MHASLCVIHAVRRMGVKIMRQEVCVNFHILSSNPTIIWILNFSQKNFSIIPSLYIEINSSAQYKNPHTSWLSFDVPRIFTFRLFTFSTAAFLLSLFFQSHSQVVLGKVKSVELVLRIRILKWSSEDFHPLRCAARLGDGGEDLSWVETLAGVVSC